MKYLSAFALLIISIISCNQKEEPLPLYGQVFMPFSYTDQNGNTIDSTTVKDKHYVVDFFFTHCPEICPKMSSNLAKIQEAVPNNDEYKIISFSIDPERDTVGRLKWYADKLGVKDGWHMVRASTAQIDSTSNIMKVDQFKDESAPGGFNHQTRFLLIDKNGEIRGSYNGLMDDETEELIGDLKQLLK